MSQSSKTIVMLLTPLADSVTVFSSESGETIRFFPNFHILSQVLGKSFEELEEETDANGGSFEIHVSDAEIAFFSGNEEAISHPNNYQGVLLAIGALLDDLAAADTYSVFTTGLTITQSALLRGEAV